MTDQHPITPPTELVKQWWKDAQQADYSDGLPCWLNYVATQAARWGADMELEACVEWLENQTLCGHRELIPSLRRLRRPTPPSLKEQALADLDSLVSDLNNLGMGFKVINIIRAIEQLPD